MSDPLKLPPMAGGQTTGGCPVDVFQEACVEVDVAVEATATTDTPVVQCVGTPQIGPFGSNFCPQDETTCGFTVSQTICIGVRVHFSATATPGTPRSACQPASLESCFPVTTCPFFEPRSQGFFSNSFDLTNFTPQQICAAAQCLRTNSGTLNTLLVACPAPGTDCADQTAESIAPCITALQGLLSMSGAQTAILALCGIAPPDSNQLATTLRQFVANWLNVCLCDTTLPPGSENIGGVSLDFRVDLSGFPAADLAALGLTGSCETVGHVLDVAESILAGCNTTLAPLISPILSDMAQDPGSTIIEPFPC